MLPRETPRFQVQECFCLKRERRRTALRQAPLWPQVPSHRAQVFSLATAGAQPRHQAASRLCRTRAVVTAPLRELGGGGGRRGKGEAEGRGWLSLPPENPGRPALTPSASARRPRRPPARPAAPRDRSGPSAVRTPGASTRPQASGAPREGPRGLRQRPRGGGREPGRAGGRSSGPPPSGAEAAPRRAVSLTFWQRRQRARIGWPAQRDRRPETWDLGGAARGRWRHRDGPMGGRGARGARGRAGRGGASRAGTPQIAEAGLWAAAPCLCRRRYGRWGTWCIRLWKGTVQINEGGDVLRYSGTVGHFSGPDSTGDSPWASAERVALTRWSWRPPYFPKKLVKMRGEVHSGYLSQALIGLGSLSSCVHLWHVYFSLHRSYYNLFMGALTWGTVLSTFLYFRTPKHRVGPQLLISGWGWGKNLNAVSYCARSLSCYWKYSYQRRQLLH